MAGYCDDVEKRGGVDAVYQWSIQRLTKGRNRNKPGAQQTGTAYYWKKEWKPTLQIHKV